MKVIWKSCVESAKKAVRVTFDKLSNGVKFEEVAHVYNSLLDRFCPDRLYRPMQYLLTFVLFHVYLLYTIIYCITKLTVEHTRIKGSRIIPQLPEVAQYKDKVIMFITSLFVCHWFSKTFLGLSAGWGYFSSWVVNLRPQINIKPQVKLVSVTDPCHSTRSSLSIDLEQVDADVNVYLSPEKKELADMMKGVQRASDTASFASDLASSVAASLTRTDSLSSLSSWPSSLTGESDEVDIDAEMDKACLLEELEKRKEAAEEGEENDPLLDGEDPKKPKRRTTTCFRLKDVAQEPLTKVSNSSGSRSKIPRSQVLERFRVRNAIANSRLRERFLKRNPSPGHEYTRLVDNAE